MVRPEATRHRFASEPGRIPGAVLVAGVLLLSSLAVVQGHDQTSGSLGSGTSALSRIPGPSTTVASAAGSVVTDRSRASTVEADRSALLASDGNLSTFEPPSLLSALPLARTVGHVAPIYRYAPAPMGVAYYGLNNTTGTVQATVVNTTSLRGYFTTSDPLGVQTEQFGSGSRTAYGAQLNAVLTNVTIGGSRAFAPNVNAPAGCSGFFNGSRSHWCPNEFWLQNVVNYDPATGELQFADNIWNFSNPAVNWLTSNGITLVGRSTPAGGFYEVAGPAFQISYPFTVVLYLNSTVGRCTTGAPGATSCAELKGNGPLNEVFFNYTVLDSAGHVVCPSVEPPNSVCGEFDDVFWNSAAHNPSGARPGSATMVADGDAYDPAGLTNDWEMDWGIGTNDGDTTSVTYANAEVGLGYCPAAEIDLANGRCRHYSAPPAAFDFGGETGETSLGEDAYYVTESSGGPVPSALAGTGAPVARLVTGPSLLQGLWNTSTPSGAYPLSYAGISPANAWVGVAAGSGITNQSRFQVAPTFGWFSARTGSGGAPKPTALGADLYLPPGVYTIEVLLSGYEPLQQTVDLRTAGASPVIGLPRGSTGVYTPMWAFSATDLANLSVSGNGTPSDPYVLLTAAGTVGTPYLLAGEIAWLFAGLNDYLYPVWLGAYLNSTRAYATFDPAPAFTLVYPSWQLHTLKRFDVPGSDGFPYYLLRAQNVTVEGAGSLDAWASVLAAPQASVVCRACFNDLFADDGFSVSSIGIDLTGATGSMRALAPYANYPGTRNVLWGSTFAGSGWVGYGGLLPPTDLVEETDSNDRIYNNAFATNVTVSEPLSSAVDAWNVTCQGGYEARDAGYYPGPVPCRPSSYEITMNGVNLSGSIAGTSYQGGNEWRSFGNWANPFANIPYVARTTSYVSGGIAQPTVGQAGDFAPLLDIRVYAVPFVETGLPTTDIPTGFEVSLQGPVNWQNATATNSHPPDCPWAPCVELFVPNGTYPYWVSNAGAGFTADPRVGSVNVSGAALTATVVTFSRTHALTLTFREHGIATGHSWCASVDGYRACTTSGKLKYGGLAAGTYGYAIVKPGTDVSVRLGKTVEPTSGSIALGRSLTLVVTYVYTYFIGFTEFGLSSGSWSVRMHGVTLSAAAADPIYFWLGNGTYRYHVLPVTGGYWEPSTGRVHLRGADLGVDIGFY